MNRVSAQTGCLVWFVRLDNAMPMPLLLKLARRVHTRERLRHHGAPLGLTSPAPNAVGKLVEIDHHRARRHLQFIGHFEACTTEIYLHFLHFYARCSY